MTQSRLLAPLALLMSMCGPQALAANVGTLHFIGALTNPTCRVHTELVNGDAIQVTLDHCSRSTALASGAGVMQDLETGQAHAPLETPGFISAGSQLQDRLKPSNNTQRQAYMLSYH